MPDWGEIVNRDGDRLGVEETALSRGTKGPSLSQDPSTQSVAHEPGQLIGPTNQPDSKAGPELSLPHRFTVSRRNRRHRDDGTMDRNSHWG